MPPCVRPFFCPSPSSDTSSCLESCDRDPQSVADLLAVGAAVVDAGNRRPRTAKIEDPSAVVGGVTRSDPVKAFANSAPRMASLVLVLLLAAAAPVPAQIPADDQ